MKAQTNVWRAQIFLASDHPWGKLASSLIRAQQTLKHFLDYHLGLNQEPKDKILNIEREGCIAAWLMVLLLCKGKFIADDSSCSFKHGIVFESQEGAAFAIQQRENIKQTKSCNWIKHKYNGKVCESRS